MGLLKNIEWTDDSKNTIVYKVDMKNDYISKGSVLTVRDSQAAVFSHKGKMADVFLPGFYKLDTDSIPVLTKLMSWKYGFENPFRSDVYFVNTKQFTNMKWGTANPIIIRDKDYGAVRVRGYGSYAFRISDPYVFLQELSGTNSSFKTQDITDYLKSIVISGISDAIGESKIPILDMAGNLIELGEVVRNSMQDTFKSMGIELTKFVFENFSMPKELEEALDKNTSLGMMRGNMDAYMAMAQADALKEAAKNPGMAGSAMGAGMGFGMGNMFGSMYAGNAAGMKAQSAEEKIVCPKCGAKVGANAKFCPECGGAMGAVCPKCGAAVKPGAKFCPECGNKLTAACPKCGAAVKPGAKFCPECGEKL
ncbi:MAG: SPFH domain-containing protein [Christensenellales bacterium]